MCVYVYTAHLYVLLYIQHVYICECVYTAIVRPCSVIICHTCMISSCGLYFSCGLIGNALYPDVSVLSLIPTVRDRPC